MSYATSSALQSALYDHLVNDTEVIAQTAGQVYDATPSGVLPDLFVLLGEETVRDRSSKDQAGASHDFTIEIVSQSPGFAPAKAAAAAVCDALVDADLTLTRGTLIGLQFLTAAARRDDDPSARVVELTFRAFVEDT